MTRRLADPMTEAPNALLRVGVAVSDATISNTASEVESQVVPVALAHLECQGAHVFIQVIEF